MEKIAFIVLFAVTFLGSIEAIEPNRHPQIFHQRAHAFDRQLLVRDNLARHVVAAVVLREVQRERRRQFANMLRCSHLATPQHKRTIANSFVNYLGTLSVAQQQTLVTKILNIMPPSQRKSFIRRCQQQFPHNSTS